MTTQAADRGFTKLWAKTDKDHPSPDRYHALPLHLVDVAAVVWELWDIHLSRHECERIADALGVDLELARTWVAFLAGCHDVGKASPVFQQIADGQLERVIRETGVSVVPYKPVKSLPHGAISAALLPAILEEHYALTRLSANRFASVTGAHHGRFFPRETLERPSRTEPRAAGTGAWDDWRVQLVDYVARAVGLPTTMPETLRARPLAVGAAFDIAGLISYADWIGSDERFFRLSTDVPNDPSVAFDAAREKAHRAMAHAGFQAAAQLPAGTIPETFPFIRQLNDGQRAAVELVEALPDPGIAVVEYPMGWGKTELALWMAARWANTHGVDGFYVGLPTRATSDQLFERVGAMFKAHCGDAPQNLVRVSGQSPLSTETRSNGAEDALREENEVFLHANPSGDRADVARERRVRAEWFGRRNRGLLARYGVGTIDQAMLGAMLNRHFFVRLAGLAGKTVILDEVHSYDLYMSTIIDRLVEYLGAMGTPVIILTATLPRHRTEALIQRYREGAGWVKPAATAKVTLPPWLQRQEEPPADTAPAVEIAAYPRMTMANASGVRSIHVADRRVPVTIQLEWIPGVMDDAPESWQPIVDGLATALVDGGTAAVICNTVAQAQAAFAALSGVFPSADLELFHARFRAKERRGIQKRVLRDLGKEAVRNGVRIRPERRIVVATQVIEQSLDLDFDLMVSMFCPVDLLLQRSGRLHRHPTTDELRPERLRDPQLWVTGYDDTGDVPEFHRGTAAVYGDFPLLRSWWAIDRTPTITIPTDIEPLIERAYGEDDDAPTDSPGVVGNWNKARDRYEKQQDEDLLKAGYGMIPATAADQPERGNNVLAKDVAISKAPEDGDPRAAGRVPTRLGDPSVTVVLLTDDEAARYAPILGDGRQPNAGDVADLLDHSVDLSRTGLVQALLDLERPKAWADVAALKFVVFLPLDRNGEATVGGTRIRLDGRLGVCIDNATGGNANARNEEEA